MSVVHVFFTFPWKSSTSVFLPSNPASFKSNTQNVGLSPAVNLTSEALEISAAVFHKRLSVLDSSLEHYIRVHFKGKNAVTTATRRGN